MLTLVLEEKRTTKQSSALWEDKDQVSPWFGSSELLLELRGSRRALWDLTKSGKVAPDQPSNR